MRDKFIYKCIQCNGLIESANKPLDVNVICSYCWSKFDNKMTALGKAKLNVDVAANQERKRIRRERAKQKREANAKKI